MIQRLIDFLNASPVNFLAIKTLKEELEKADFQNLDPSESLDGLKPGSQFYVTKNDSSLYAFRLGNEPLQKDVASISSALIVTLPLSESNPTQKSPRKEWSD